MAIDKDLLDRLLEGRDPSELFARDGLLDDLKKALSERILELRDAGRTSRQIAQTLNAEAWRPPKRRSSFTPGMVRRLEPRIRELCTAILDTALARGACDFVRDVAAELPVQVIAEIMGVPPEDRHRLSEWGDRLTGMDDPETAVSPEATVWNTGWTGWPVAALRTATSSLRAWCSRW